MLSKSGLTRFLNRAQAAVGVVGVVDVLLADDATLKRLNRDFRGKNKSTDVLSFPSSTVDEGGDAAFAGDIAISLETAGRQADLFEHALRDEVRILLVHGLLHLSGMDHETDDGEMAVREGELRVALRLPVSLIERVMVGGKGRATGKGKGNRKRAPSGVITKEATTKAKVEARAGKKAAQKKVGK
ncbi:Metal-dependent hydrolase YbeY, involved in rRNA and/or ribosome maturation and assembly [Granulicella sibirica]|uniref:Endoribonuclease YbeY n=1 Tax=Granulicella sibirica TaxID=2479048 RepID=A0A4Q0T751_9BACT|nr:Metal-dependent hydrolase YbeY, involved in rRNA and/or ribosome maturation and assembly [Granulicella sibirica]